MKQALAKQLLAAFIIGTGIICTGFSQPAVAAKKVVEQNTKQAALVNINKADAQRLSSLPGIGLKKAKLIVAYRKLNGSFKSKEELTNVKGIGPKMLAKVIDQVSI